MQQAMSATQFYTGYPKTKSKKTLYATIGSKYQMVIPKDIRQDLNIKPGDKLYVGVGKEGTITLSVPPKNWAEQNFGALKKYWKGIDMIEEVEKIRNEADI